MPADRLMDTAADAVKQAAPTDANSYLIYMIVFFMALCIGAALLALNMWLKYQRSIGPERTSLGLTEVERNEIKVNAEQGLMLNIHEGRLDKAEKEIADNVKAISRLTEAIENLVQVTENQSNRMLQHDNIINKLTEIIGKQSRILDRYSRDK